MEHLSSPLVAPYLRHLNLRDTVSQKLDRLNPCYSVDTSVVCRLLEFPVWEAMRTGLAFHRQILLMCVWVNSFSHSGQFTIQRGIVLRLDDDAVGHAHTLLGKARRSRLEQTASKLEQFSGRCYSILFRWKKLTAKQISSVPCPACGVAAGKRCVLLSGAPRNEPHANRKIAATEAVEKERFKSAAD